MVMNSDMMYGPYLDGSIVIKDAGGNYRINYPALDKFVVEQTLGGTPPAGPGIDTNPRFGGSGDPWPAP